MSSLLLPSPLFFRCYAALALSAIVLVSAQNDTTFATTAEDVYSGDGAPSSLVETYQRLRGNLISFGSESFQAQASLFAAIVLMGTVTILTLTLGRDDNDNNDIGTTADDGISLPLAAAHESYYDNNWESCMLDRPSSCNEHIV